MQRLLACALFAGAATTAGADVLDDYVGLAVGSFTSAAQARHDSRYVASTWHIREIWAGAGLSGRWLYVESWIDGAAAPYLQRVSQLTATAHGDVEARRYAIRDPERARGGWHDASRFDDISIDDLTGLEGCGALFTRAGVDRFEGGTFGNRCKNSYKGASYVISRSTLTADGMINWDRGFSDDGELVWGPATGGYRFRRSDSDEGCLDPVRMLVYGTIADRARFMAYIAALAQSGLYERSQGYYEALTPPLAVFEGAPPAERGVIIAQFPCLAKAEQFWYSEEYAEIRKLREGVAEFEVLVLRVPPKPAYLEH